MAINYTKIGWDTTKYVNPTNMNQMDDGIKAACDGVDSLTGAWLPTGANGRTLLKSTESGYAYMFLKTAANDNAKGGLGFFEDVGAGANAGAGVYISNELCSGFMGVSNDGKPYFAQNGLGASYRKEIALKDDTAKSKVAIHYTESGFTMPIPSDLQIGLVIATNASNYCVGVISQFGGVYYLNAVANTCGLAISGSDITVATDYTRIQLMYT